MPRKKKPVPPDFRDAVKYDGLGFQRLKKRFGVGMATIQRWLSESRLQTRNTPNDSLAKYNKKRSAPTSEQLWARLREAERQEQARSLGAQPQSYRAHSQQNQALAQPRQAHSQSKRDHSSKRQVRAQSADRPHYSEDELEKARKALLKSADEKGLIEIWPRIAHYFNEVADNFPEHDQRSALIRPIGLRIKERFKGPIYTIAIKALFRWVNGTRAFCEAEPTAAAVLFLEAGHDVIEDARNTPSLSSVSPMPQVTESNRSRSSEPPA